MFLGCFKHMCPCTLVITLTLNLILIQMDVMFRTQNNSQYLSIRKCQLMSLVVKATNTFPVHKNLK